MPVNKKPKSNNSLTPLLTSSREIVATKEDRKLKEGGRVITTKDPVAISGIPANYAAQVFKERNDGYYAAFDVRGDRLFYSIGPKVVRQLNSLEAGAISRN